VESRICPSHTTSPQAALGSKPKEQPKTQKTKAESLNFHQTKSLNLNISQTQTLHMLIPHKNLQPPFLKLKVYISVDFLLISE
jgi:hypothetical protein